MDITDRPPVCGGYGLNIFDIFQRKGFCGVDPFDTFSWKRQNFSVISTPVYESAKIDPCATYGSVDCHLKINLFFNMIVTVHFLVDG